MQSIKEVIEKYKIDIADEEVHYMLTQDLLADRTNFDYIDREMLDEEKYPVDINSEISVGDQYKAYGLEEIDIDPLFVFMGECKDEYIYAVTDRKIYRDADGKVSKPIIQNFNLIDGDAETNKFYARPDVTYVRAKFIEELPYISKTETDNVVGLGEMMDANAMNCYNDTSYQRLVNHRLALYPCGEDDEKYYAYAVYAGDLVLNKATGPDPVYGMFALTTPEGVFILITQDKNMKLEDAVQSEETVKEDDEA